MTPRSTSWFWPITVIVLGVIYVVLTGAVSVSETCGGVLALAAAVVVARAQHIHARRPIRVRAPWVRLGLALPAALLRESAAVGGVLLRSIIAPRTGRIIVQPFERGDESAVATGRRAAVILATSLAPNAFVVRTTQEALLMHQLIEVPDKTDREWPL
jgi:hypothetical protein